MSKVELSDTYVRETDSRIRHREFLLQGIEKLTLLHDTFMKVALKDVEACQHVIRILMDDPTIEIVEVRSQYRISKLVSKDAVLDILAEDTQGRSIIWRSRGRRPSIMPGVPGGTAPWWMRNIWKRGKNTTRCRRCM